MEGNDVMDSQDGGRLTGLATCRRQAQDKMDWDGRLVLSPGRPAQRKGGVGFTQLVFFV